MKLRIATLACLLFVCLSAVAQQPSTNAEPATREQVLKIMEMTGAKQNVSLMIDGMKKSIKESMLASIKEKVPNSPPAMLEELGGIVDQMFSSMKADDMVQLTIPIYEKHMTKAEADAVIRFYSSPEGASFIKKTPLIMTESMQAGSKYGEDSVQKVMPDLQKQVEQIVTKYSTELNKTSPKQDSPAK